MMTTNSNDSLLFFDEYFEPFFEDLPANRNPNSYSTGQLFWCPFPYSYEHQELWRPTKLEASNTVASTFEIKTSSSDAFNRSLPLSVPKLETNEELIVVRAKIRLVVLIRLRTEKVNKALETKRSQINSDRCTVVPFYSLINKYEELKVKEEFVERLRMMDYPQFMFIPPYEKKNIRMSFLKLDSINSLHQTHLEPLFLKLHDDVMKILHDQIIFFLHGIRKDNSYLELREMLKEQL